MFLDNVVEHCQTNLLQVNSKLPLCYLASRGITLSEIKTYKIGYLGKFTKNIPNPEGIADIDNFNKWMGSNGYFIRNRIVFPIYDELGNIKGIETRSLDQQAMETLLPKYKDGLKKEIESLNESDIRYKKFYLEGNKHTAFFFGIPHALENIWKTKEVFLTEGIFDAISILKIKNNCISCLTANINEYQIAWLRRYIEKLFIIFDGDKKGKSAISKIKENLGDSLNIYSIELKNKDVNDFLVKQGIRELQLTIDSKLKTFF